MADDLAALKQACLNISQAATDMFDEFDQHGIEAPWRPGGSGALIRLAQSFDLLEGFVASQVVDRLAALGVDRLAALGVDRAAVDRLRARVREGATNG